METVTITKKEYEKLKKASQIDYELIENIKKSFEDIKQGKIKKWAH